MKAHGLILIAAVIGLGAIAERLTAAFGWHPEAAFLVFIALAVAAWRWL